MNSARMALLAAVLVPFTAFTARLVEADGYLGFVRLARREPWGLQMLLDLSIMVGLFGIWLVGDRKHAAGRLARSGQSQSQSHAHWPGTVLWLVACGFLGSPAALSYLLVREIRGRSPVAANQG